MLRFTVLSILTMFAYLTLSVGLLFIDVYYLEYDSIESSIVEYAWMPVAAMAVGGLFSTAFSIMVVRKREGKFMWADNRVGRLMKDKQVNFCSFYHVSASIGCMTLVAISLIALTFIASEPAPAYEFTQEEEFRPWFVPVAGVSLFLLLGLTIAGIVKALRLKRYVCPQIEAGE